MRGSYKPGQTVFDSPDDFDSWDRCITRGLPVSMLPRNYNNGIRIMQFPGYVVILLEMAHEARIIPTDEAPGARWLDQAVSGRVERTLGRQYAGRRDDELQRQDRDDQPRRSRVAGADAVHGEPALHRALHANRQDTIDYQMTVEDPEVLTTGKWSAAFPLKLDNDYKMYEYACHEGNTAIRNYIETSRFERAKKKPVSG